VVAPTAMLMTSLPSENPISAMLTVGFSITTGPRFKSVLALFVLALAASRITFSVLARLATPFRSANFPATKLTENSLGGAVTRVVDVFVPLWIAVLLALTTSAPLKSATASLGFGSVRK